MSTFSQCSLLLDLGHAGTLIALMLAGHALGDFVFQTGEMVQRKNELRWLIYHTLEVTLIQGVLLLPFFSARTALVLLGIGLVHLAIDRLKVVFDDASRALAYFFLDQLAHLVTLGAGCWVLTRLGVRPLAFFEPYTGILTTVAVGIAGYAFCWNGGAAVIRILLESFELPKADDPARSVERTQRTGWTIGILERMLLLTVVLVDQWGALGLILAAKSLARFKDLEQREFGEYYLIGTLTSVLVAIATGLLIRILV